MKISIGSRIIHGPWCGGNLFVINLSNFLIQNGHEVVYDLSHKDIDLILLTDPRAKNESTSKFNHSDILKYKKYVNSNVTVVQRINECDERKDTSGINNFYLEASKCADKVIFVSKWLASIYNKLGLEKDKTIIIMSGSDNNIFSPSSMDINLPKKFSLVTHHWSSHHNKGFDTYNMIDESLNNQKWKNLIEFTYIGNLSDNQNFKNIKVLKPLSGIDLAKELKKHHIYVTGSINEPSGNHHIEGALCGLPILYKKSGGIPEYCNGFGEAFENNFFEKLELIINNYSQYKTKIKNYPYISEKMCQEYLDLFNYLILNKEHFSVKETQKAKVLSLLFRVKHKVVDNFLVFLKEQLKNKIVKSFNIIRRK